jgi:hypothetical protein
MPSRLTSAFTIGHITSMGRVIGTVEFTVCWCPVIGPGGIIIIEDVVTASGTIP